MIHLRLTNTWYTLISLALIGLPFYQNGVFFEEGHLLVDVILILCLAITLVVLAIGRNPNAKNQQASVDHARLNRYDAAFLLYVLLYALSLLHTPNFTRALVGALDGLALVFPYFVFRWRPPTPLGGNMVILGISISSIVINTVGMANAWHALTFPDAFDFTNHQVSSVFQYHNAYGSFVAAVSLLLLAYVGQMDIRRSWLSIIYTGVISINISGLLVSDSRGALMFWIVALLLLIVGTNQQFDFHTARGQLLMLFYTSLVGVGVGYPFLHKGILSASSFSGWLGVALGLVLPMLLTIIIRKWLNQNESRLVRWMTFNRMLSIGILGFIVAGVVKFHAVLQKLETYHANQLSVSQRFIFWKDGLKIWVQSPIFGLGANSWHTLYEKFQTYPYYSTRSHSFLVDTLIEVGLVGLIALLVALWPMVRATVWPYHSNNSPESLEAVAESLVLAGQPTGSVSSVGQNTVVYRSLALMGFALFLHSMMDWDMSFSYLRILMTLGMGASAALFASRCGTMARLQPGWGQRFTAVFQRKGVAYTVSGIAAVALLLGAFFGIQLFRANQIVTSVQTLPPSATTLARLLTAQSLAPYDAAIVVDIASTENALSHTSGISPTQAQTNAEQALSTYENASRLAPYDANIHGATATLAYNLGKFQTAYEYAKQAYEDAPFYPNNVEVAMNGGTVYGMSIGKSQPAKSQVILRDVLNLYQQYLKRDQVVHHLPSYLPPMNSYELQPFTYDSLAAAALATKQPQQATQLARNAESSTDAHSKQLAQLIILIARRDEGESVTAQQITQFVAQNPGLQSSYNLLSNVIN